LCGADTCPKHLKQNLGKKPQPWWSATIDLRAAPLSCMDIIQQEAG
jgi:hypothetical protein